MVSYVQQTNNELGDQNSFLTSIKLGKRGRIYTIFRPKKKVKSRNSLHGYKERFFLACFGNFVSNVMGGLIYYMFDRPQCYLFTCSGKRGYVYSKQTPEQTRKSKTKVEICGIWCGEIRVMTLFIAHCRQ